MANRKTAKNQWPAVQPGVRPHRPFAVASLVAASGLSRDETAEPPAASEVVDMPVAQEAQGAQEVPVAEEAEPPPRVEGHGGVLHTKHDVDRAMTEVKALVTAFAQHGIPIAIDQIDATTLRPRAQAYALCRLLVAKGLVTQEEIQCEEALILQQMLSQLYQHAEEQALAAARPQLILPGRN